MREILFILFNQQLSQLMKNNLLQIQSKQILYVYKLELVVMSNR